MSACDPPPSPHHRLRLPNFPVGLSIPVNHPANPTTWTPSSECRTILRERERGRSDETMSSNCSVTEALMHSGSVHLKSGCRLRSVELRSPSFVGLVAMASFQFTCISCCQFISGMPRANTHPRSVHTTTGFRIPTHSEGHAPLGCPREMPLPSPSLPQFQSHCSTMSTQPSPYNPYSFPSKQDSVFLTTGAFHEVFAMDKHDPTNSSKSNGSFQDPGSPRESSSPELPHPRFISESQMNCDKELTSSNILSSCSELGDPKPRNHERSPSPPSPPVLSHASSLVLPFSRPNSIPKDFSGSNHTQNHTNPYWPDRTSSASLPLPSHTPFTALPSVAVPQLSQDSSAQNQQYGGNSSIAQSTIMETQPLTDYFQLVPSTPRSSWQGFPPPASPIILSPPATPHPWRPGEDARPQLPFEPFLSNAPASDECRITIETTPLTYLLTVRLPGFNRDGITLATRRRRILHIMANSWETSGGHFERRIAFGYDADLSQVRAEFDGEYLRVTIPRRPPVTSWFNLSP